jgi:hypothetical protein
MIRNAWDTGTLQALTKSPTRASDAHISIIGHITNEELREKLTKTEQANGFANRFIWVCVRRKRKIGRRNKQARALDLTALHERFAAAAQFARQVEEIDLAPESEPLWEHFYEALPDETPGIFGALTGRAEAHVSRLASTYALLDHSAVIRPAHLKAAITLWEFSERCVRYIFGDKTGTPIGDTILAHLRKCADGATREELRKLFQGHQTSEAIDQVLQSLSYSNQIEYARVGTGGRPRQVWHLVNRAAIAPPLFGPALREMIPQINDAEAGKLWHACRIHSADCTAEEVLHAVALQMPSVRSGRIAHPVAFLLSAVPQWIASTALAEYRAAQHPPPPAELPKRDLEAEIDTAYQALNLYRQMLADASSDEARQVQQGNITGAESRLKRLEAERGVGVGGNKRDKRGKRDNASSK